MKFNSIKIILKYRQYISIKCNISYLKTTIYPFHSDEIYNLTHFQQLFTKKNKNEELNDDKKKTKEDDENDDEIEAKSSDDSDDENKKKKKDKDKDDDDDDDDDDRSGGLLIPIVELVAGLFPKVAKSGSA